jgi:integrase
MSSPTCGGAWTDKIGIADDYENADGEHILDFWMACEKARQMGRGKSAGAPATVSEALDTYAKDLEARGGSKVNASVVRRHLQDHPALLNKTVGELIGKELAHWRDALTKKHGIKIATVLRICKSAKAALNLAARLDPRIQNRNAWRDGLSGLKDDSEPINRVLSDADVLKLVAAAYELEPGFGLFVDLLASCGCRTSQATRLVVADLQLGDNGTPRLMMPPSRKGKRKSAAKRPVPITKTLAARLKAAANSRAAHEPLLRDANGAAWNPQADDRWKLFGTIAATTGIGGTAYQLRHSSITRMLIRGTPVRVVAAMHDTSTYQIERTYSAFISDFADTVARKGLLDTSEPVTGNVVNLRG